MKKEPRAFYQAQIEEHTQSLQQLKKQLAVSSTIRLFAFLAACLGIYLVFGNTPAILGIVIVGAILFIILVNRHSQLQYERDLQKALIALNETELEVLHRAFHHLPDGAEYSDDAHAFSQDIDLFGRGSFFQYLNRTALKSGSDYLATLLKSNDTDAILLKQKAIQELCEKASWRQHFSAVGSLVKTEVSPNRVMNWLSNYTAFTPSWIPWVSPLFSVLSVAGIAAYFLGFLSGYWVVGWFFLGLAISGRYVKQVNKLSQHSSKVQSTFEQFYKLISEIESESFSSTLLQQKKEQILQKNEKASSILKQFAKQLDALDQRNNMLVGIFANGFMLRDILVSHKIEKWIESHGKQVGDWFEVISFFDAFNSLGNYAFNHQDHSFPELSTTVQLQAKGAGHPLLFPDTMVRNDFNIAEEEFFIVTGANMAGKSTFLRTVSLLIVMGNVGLPVCAKSATYKPIKLITSMRTTDSLTDDESYFFSELKRLKFIVEQLQTERYFIILDEILKGTNSTDKAIGSRKFVEKLVAGNSTGIIATHDLSLCEVADTLDEVKNYYFGAEIIDDELHFDYTLKKGICQNMNASFLLKKMNIVD
ncbi:DNA mismatch repair protein MutS [Flavobacteriaceae bacterium TK19130]|nr:DNA mismatch repair protein MutS [Thermobacterium salinum]